MRVGFLGPEGTLSEEALLTLPGSADWERASFATLRDVLHAVQDGSVDKGIVPIENSIDGAVRQTLDTLAFETDEVVIESEFVHAVTHCLLARPGTPFDAIETVASHPQAIAQCGRFLRTRLGHAAVLPVASSAEAVRLASHRPGWAALGTRRAGELYGAAVLHDRVDDTVGNETRYACVVRAGEESPPDEGNAKTTLVFWGEGAAGPAWLVRCLEEFGNRAVNLCRIESRPRGEGFGHYAFFLDVDGPVDAPSVTKAIEGLRKHADVVRVLGSYTAKT